MNLLKTILAFTLLCSPALRAVEVTLVSVNGEEISGPLTAIDAGTGFTVGGKTLKLEEAAEVRFPGKGEIKAESGTQVMLLTGSAINAKIVSGNEKALKINSPLLGEIEIKNNAIKGMIFTRGDIPENKFNDFFAGSDPDKDSILTPKAEKQTGFMVSLSDKALDFDQEGQKRSIPFEQLGALRYAELEKFKPLTGVQGSVTLSDGSKLTGVLSGLKGEKLDLKVYEDQMISVPMEAIRALALAGGKLIYLSDFPALNVEEKPLVGGFPVIFHWKKNKAVTGGVMKIAGKEYARGIGVHAYAKITLRLEGQYEKLLVDPGLDDTGLSGPGCEWRIVGDGKDLAKGEAKLGQAPTPGKFDVKGVKVLELIADFGPDNDDAGDHLNWANARLVKN